MKTMEIKENRRLGEHHAYETRVGGDRSRHFSSVTPEQAVRAIDVWLSGYEGNPWKDA